MSPYQLNGVLLFQTKAITVKTDSLNSTTGFIKYIAGLIRFIVILKKSFLSLGPKLLYVWEKQNQKYGILYFKTIKTINKRINKAM